MIPDALEDFDRLLKQSIGLDVASIGVSALDRAVQERLRACGERDTRAYLDHVRVSSSELQALIDAVIVPETWFFRDREAFAALVRYVKDEWLASHSDGCIRLLSLPCSTGEEPYSIAMALLDAQIAPSRFRIDAVDVCGRSLDLARQGMYGKGSFRGEDIAYRERYFELAGTRYALKNVVRREVNFHQGNLFHPGFLTASSAYDVIFCRNLLIYFDRETQERAIDVIERVLSPTGVLFVGSSESAPFLSRAFSSAKVPMAFALRKVRSVSKPGPAALSNDRRAAPAHKRARPATAVAAAALAAEPEPQPASGPKEALRLADQGHFAEASRCCEEYLRSHGPSAEVFHVLGLVRDALGNADEAATFYRKALYLNPRYEDAVVHLALLMEKIGQTSEAQALRHRARRLVGPGPQ